MQRGCNLSAFVSALNLIPTSYGTLSVCGFGTSVTEKSYRVTKIGLNIPTGVEYARILVSHPPSSKLEFINDFSDFSFDVDIPLGADAVFRFLDAISDSHSEPLVQEPEFGHVLCGPLPRLSKSIKDVSLASIRLHFPLERKIVLSFFPQQHIGDSTSYRFSISCFLLQEENMATLNGKLMLLRDPNFDSEKVPEGCGLGKSLRKDRKKDVAIPDFAVVTTV